MINKILKQSNKLFSLKSFGKTLSLNKNYLRHSLVNYPFSKSKDNLESDEDFKPKTKYNNQDIEYNFREIKFDLENITEENILQKLKENIDNNKVVIFIKGTCDSPLCGYSKFVVEVLKFYKVKEITFLNVLQSDLVRTSGILFIFSLLHNLS